MNYSNENDVWEWHQDNSLRKDANLDLSNLLGGVSQSDDLPYIFEDEATPAKPYEDLAFPDTSLENTGKESAYSREPFSQVKRRRMLQFESEILDAPLCHEDFSSVFLSSKETENSLEVSLSEMTPWVSGFTESLSASSTADLDQSPEEWIADCFNDSEMHCSPDETLSGAPDIQIDISDICNSPLENEANMVQEQPIQISKNVVFRGKKSYIRTPAKVSSSVVYPFAFIKPCGAHGDITLKDINQRICKPQPTSKQSKEDPSVSYPTSAFSGKPVVGKTKIHTEGGKGSITIMRTKG